MVENTQGGFQAKGDKDGVYDHRGVVHCVHQFEAADAHVTTMDGIEIHVCNRLNVLIWLTGLAHVTNP